MGHRNGTANIPGAGDTTPDGYEARIAHEIGRRVEIARGRASKVIRDIETSIKARQLSPAVKRCGEIPDAFVREQAIQSSSLRNRLGRCEGELRDVETEMEDYRARYDVRRALRLSAQEDRNNRWALLLLFTLVQFAANSILIGEGSDYGLALGITLAFIFAFFDISIHLVLGDISARIQAPDLIARTMGVIATLTWLVTAVGVNMSMVHLRLVTRQYGIGAWEEWSSSIRGSTFDFDFLSWALLAIGLLCSLLAVRSGFTWDEPIPTLRRNGGRALRLRDDVEDLRDEQCSLTSDLLQRFRQELDAIDRRAEDHVSVISDSKNRIDQVVSEFASHCATAKATLEALIRTYRDDNRRHRSERPPTYFGELLTVEFSPQLDASVESLTHVLAQSHQDHEELRISLPSARRRLHELAQSEEARLERSRV
jgi:hypothetical protein